MRKVAVSGSHGTGKTTLLRALATMAGESLVVVDEVPRVLARMAADPGYLQREANTFNRQTVIKMGQVALETEAGSSPTSSLILTDRTVVDHLAYTKFLFADELKTPEGELLEESVRLWTKTYSAIFVLRPEFPPVDDGTRESDESFQHDIDRLIVEYYSLWDIETVELSGTTENRASTFWAHLGGEPN